jgi:hypothetical protein
MAYNKSRHRIRNVKIRMCVQIEAIYGEKRERKKLSTISNVPKTMLLQIGRTAIEPFRSVIVP